MDAGSRPYVGGLSLQVLGRKVTGDALVLPRGTRALLGAVQLEVMDLVVVPRTGKVIPNPEHPDGPILERSARASRGCSAPLSTARRPLANGRFGRGPA